MDQETAPVGWIAPGTPVTVVVRVVIPPKVEFGDIPKVIAGNC